MELRHRGGEANCTQERADLHEVVAELPQLNTLLLTFACSQWQEMRFTAFCRIQSLRTLILSVSDLRRPTLTVDQLSDLRSLSQLESLQWPVSESEEFWRMFAAGHQLQLKSLDISQRICPLGVDDQGAALLLLLPSLTHLQFSSGALSSLSFLSALPRLTSVSMTINVDFRHAPSLKGLVPLNSIQHLWLKDTTWIGRELVDLNAYLTRLFECSPQLQSLMIVGFTILIAAASSFARRFIIVPVRRSLCRRGGARVAAAATGVSERGHQGDIHS